MSQKKPISQWLKSEAIIAIKSNIALRRAIEDHYGITGYNTINIWLIKRSRKLIHQPIINLIMNYSGLTEEQILSDFEKVSTGSEQ